MFSIFRRRRDRTAAPLTAGSEAAFDRDGLLGPDSIVVEGAATLSGDSADPRELARQTTAKIDAIESEMIRDLAPTRPVAVMPSGAPPAGGTRAVLPARVQNPGPAAPPLASPTAIPSVEHSPAIPSASLETVLTGPALRTDPPLPDTAQRSQAPAPDRLEEAAVLYANGQFGQSESVLRAVLDAQSPGEPSQSAWAMLLDLYRSTGRRAEFEACAARLAPSFASTVPTWDEASPALDVPDRAATLPAWVSLPETLDATARHAFEEVKRLAQQGRCVALDVRAVVRVAPVGADLMLRTLSAFARSRRELEVVGTDALLGVVARSCGTPAAAAASQMCWLLHLELLRLLGRRTHFEDVSIDYCARWEVPPPLWSAMPDSVRAAVPGELRSASSPSCAVAEGIESDVIEFRGRLEGRATEALAQLRRRAAGCDQLVVDCRHLRRVDFSAAGELLNEVVALTSAGKYLRFRDVSPLVAALMAVLGITDLAEVTPRHP